MMISLIKKKGVNPQDKSTLYFPQWTRVSTIRETQLTSKLLCPTAVRPAADVKKGVGGKHQSQVFISYSIYKLARTEEISP